MKTKTELSYDCYNIKAKNKSVKLIEIKTNDFIDSFK